MNDGSQETINAESTILDDKDMNDGSQKTINAESTTLDDKDMKMLELLFDEWKFRLAEFWPLMTKFYLLSLILMILPVMYHTWAPGIDLIIPIRVFPIFAIVFSGIICAYAYNEMKKADLIKKWLRDTMNGKNSNLFKNAFPQKQEKHHRIPFVICGLQALVALIIFCSL